MIIKNKLQISGNQNYIYAAGRRVTKVYYNGGRYLNLQTHFPNIKTPYYAAFGLDKDYFVYDNSNRKFIPVNAVLFGANWSAWQGTPGRGVGIPQLTISFPGGSPVARFKTYGFGYRVTWTASISFYDRYRGERIIVLNAGNTGHNIAYKLTSDTSTKTLLWVSGDSPVGYKTTFKTGYAPYSSSCFRSQLFCKDFDVSFN